jgi:hypothetical protein
LGALKGLFMDSVDHNKFVPDHSMLEGNDKVSNHSMPSNTPEIDEKIEQLSFDIIIGTNTGIEENIADLSEMNFEMMGDFSFLLNEGIGQEVSSNEQTANNIDIFAEKFFMPSFGNETAPEVNSFTIDSLLVDSNTVEQSDIVIVNTEEMSSSITDILNMIGNCQSSDEINQFVQVIVFEPNEEVNSLPLHQIDIRSSAGFYDIVNNRLVVDRPLTDKQHKSIQNRYGQNVNVVLVASNTLRNFLDALHDRVIDLRMQEARQKNEDTQTTVSQSWRPSRAPTAKQNRRLDSKNEDNLNKPIADIKNKVAMSFVEDDMRADDKKHKQEKEAAEKARDIERQEVKKQEHKTEIIKEEIKKKS